MVLRNVRFIIDRTLWKAFADRKDQRDKIDNANKAYSVAIIYHIQSGNNWRLTLEISQKLLTIWRGKPDVFQADLRSMGGVKFGAGKINTAFQLNALPSTDSGQDKSKQSNRSGPANEPPIGISFLFTIFGILYCFIGGLWGWDNFYKGRRLLGAALIGSSWLLGGLGLSLFLWMMVSS